ncbi:DUF4404 family protein [Pseudomonas sp. SWRI154]|nr:DUF4404 family protein [Pseudomonas sp. SWRI154]MBC3362027.1 DUF4404 family protein [Pseudomonas sp. SWRI154]
MPASRELQEQLDALREQLDQSPPLTDPERESLQGQLNTLRERLGEDSPLPEPQRENLQELMAQLEAKIQLETALPNSSLADDVNLAVERFEVDYPGIASTLRNIILTLGNMGI